jgi:hypothetical protein
MNRRSQKLQLMKKKMPIMISTQLRKVENYAERNFAVRIDPSSEVYETRSLMWNVYHDKLKR